MAWAVTKMTGRLAVAGSAFSRWVILIPSMGLPWYILWASDTSINTTSTSPLRAMAITSSTSSVCLTARPPRLVKILENTRAFTRSSSTSKTVFIVCLIPIIG